MHIYYYSTTEKPGSRNTAEGWSGDYRMHVLKGGYFRFPQEKKPSGSPESETWCCRLWVETYRVPCKFVVFKSLPCTSPAHLCITLNLAAHVCVHKYARNESRVVLEAVVRFAGLVDRKITLFFLFFLLNWDIQIGHQEDTVNKEPGVAVFRQAVFGVGLHFRRC